VAAPSGSAVGVSPCGPAGIAALVLVFCLATPLSQQRSRSLNLV